MARYGVDILLAALFEWALLMSACAGLHGAGDPTNVTRTRLQGVWNGISVNDCNPVQFDPSRCHAVERISFTMLPHNERSWGFYRCAPGTTPCYNQVDRGEIKYLELNGAVLWLRVMRDDHASCLFHTIPAEDRMQGKFWCFQGATIIERGLWQVDRAY